MKNLMWTLFIVAFFSLTGCQSAPKKEAGYLDPEFAAKNIGDVAILKPAVRLRQKEPYFSLAEFTDSLSAGLTKRGISHHFVQTSYSRSVDISKPEDVKTAYTGKERFILLSDIEIHREWGEPSNVDPRGKGRAIQGNKVIVLESSICWVIKIQCALLDTHEGKLLWADGVKIGPIANGYAIELRPGVIEIITDEIMGTLPK